MTAGLFGVTGGEQFIADCVVVDTAFFEFVAGHLHQFEGATQEPFDGVFYRYNIGKEFFEFVLDRKSTLLNSSHVSISYAVFCLKKKKKRCQNHLSIKQVVLQEKQSLLHDMKIVHHFNHYQFFIKTFFIHIIFVKVINDNYFIYL